MEYFNYFGWEVSGTDYNNGTKNTLNFTGGIDNDGYIKVYLKGTKQNFVIQGKLRQRGDTLTGILELFCDNTLACLSIEISLKRKSSNIKALSSSSQEAGVDLSFSDVLENKKTDNCLPKRGTLIIKMKDGSKKIIDLSEAETITVVP